VRQANQQQDEQPPHVERHEARAALRGPLHLDRHPPAKEEREKGVELGLDKEFNAQHHGPVYGTHPIQRPVEVAGKAQHIKDEDAENGETTENVNNLDTPLGLHRGHW